MSMRMLLSVAALLAFALLACSKGAPVAALDAPVKSGSAPLRVSFTNLSENANEFEWDFGDGVQFKTADLAELIEHEFRTAGSYAVTLTARRGEESSVATLVIEVAPGALVGVVLNVTEASVVAGDTFLFSARAVDTVGNDAVGAMVTLRADPAAGTIDSAGNFTAVTTAGVYEQAVVAAATRDGVEVTGSAKVVVQPGPAVSVVIEPSELAVEADGAGRFRVSALDKYGNIIPDTAASFSVTKEAGLVDTRGRFHAGTKAGRYEDAVTVSLSSGDTLTTATATVVVAPGPLDHVTIDPKSVVVRAGEPQLFVAEAFDQFDNLIPSSELSFTFTADESAGVVDAIGIFTASTAAGTPDGGVSVRVQQREESRRAAAQVRIVPGPLDYLTLDSATTTSAGSADLRLIATPRDQYGNAIPDLVVTYAADPKVGAIASDGTLIASTVAGLYENLVTATVSQARVVRSLSTDVLIVPGSPDSVAFRPDLDVLSAGETVQLTAVAFDRFGNAIPDAAYALSASEQVGTVNPDGTLTVSSAVGTFEDGLSAELTFETAEGSVSLKASATARVGPGPAAEVRVEPAEAEVDINGNASFMAKSFDRFGNAIGGLVVTFEADRQAGQVDSRGRFTAGTKAGTFEQGVTASVKQGTKVVLGKAVVTVRPGPAVEAVVVPGSVVVAAGESVQLTAMGLDAFGNPISDVPVLWFSAGRLGSIDASGLLTAGDRSGVFSEGIRAIITVGEGSVETFVAVEVVPAAPASVQVTVGGTVEVMGTRQLVASAVDRFGNKIANPVVSWAMADPRAGTVSATGLFTAGEVAGTYPDAVEVTALADGTMLRTGTTITVGPGSLDRVVIGPDNPEIGRGMTQQFVAVPVDRFGNRLGDVGFLWSFSGGSSAGTLNATGLFTAASTSAAFHNAIRAETTAGFATRSATASVTVGPDRFVFHSNREDGRFEAYAADFPVTSVRRITTGGGQRAVWSPDGRLLAYDNQGALFTVGDDGRWAAPLTMPGIQAQEASWSSSQSTFVFRGGTTSTEIYTVGVDGAGLRQLTNNTTTDAQPSWAPGSGEIVFVAERDGNPEIYSMKADGSGLVRLTNNAALGGTGEDTAPSWQVGAEILFSSKRSGLVSAIYAVQSDGSGVRQLTPADAFSDNASCPSWTADGQRFVYHAGSGAEPPDLFMRDASGANLTALITNDASDLCPRWAPRKQGVYLTAAGVVIPNAAVGTPLPHGDVLARARAATVGVETDERRGAGFVIAPGNLVMTANHVITGAGTITVRLADGTAQTATVVGRDLVRDLALLTLGSSVSLPSLSFDEVGRLRAGDLLVAGGFTGGCCDYHRSPVHSPRRRSSTERRVGTYRRHIRHGTRWRAAGRATRRSDGDDIVTICIHGAGRRGARYRRQYHPELSRPPEGRGGHR